MRGPGNVGEGRRDIHVGRKIHVGSIYTHTNVESTT